MGMVDKAAGAFAASMVVVFLVAGCGDGSNTDQVSTGEVGVGSEATPSEVTVPEEVSAYDATFYDGLLASATHLSVAEELASGFSYTDSGDDTEARGVTLDASAIQSLGDIGVDVSDIDEQRASGYFARNLPMPSGAAILAYIRIPPEEYATLEIPDPDNRMLWAYVVFELNGKRYAVIKSLGMSAEDVSDYISSLR